jgi:N-acyl homoserine lactone hydrolase
MTTITLLDVGRLVVPPGVLRAGEDLERPVRLPIPAYLLETATDRVLIDTGLHPAAVADAGAHYGDPGALGPFGIEQEQSVADLVDLDSLTLVVLTHLHFDHAGGLALLPPSVPVVLQRREWLAGVDPVGIARNAFRPRDYAPIADRVTLIDGDHDLFDDGAIELLSTPGHTAGHQSVRVDGHLVIGGDVAPFATALDDHRFPIFGDDLDTQAASAVQLRELRDAGSVVLPGHDPEVLRAGVVGGG